MLMPQWDVSFDCRGAITTKQKSRICKRIGSHDFWAKYCHILPGFNASLQVFRFSSCCSRCHIFGDCKDLKFTWLMLSPEMCGFFFGIPLKCGLFYECAWFFRFVVAWPGENPFWTWSMPRKCVISRFPCILPEVPSQWIENQDATNKEFLSSSGIAARPSVWNRYIKVARQLGNSLEVWLFRRNRTIANTTIWLFNIAMENGPFIDGLPIKNGGSFHGYVRNNQRATVFLHDLGLELMDHEMLSRI